MIMKFVRYVFLVAPALLGQCEGIFLDETANGSTIQTVPGHVIAIALHSTYWQIDGSSDLSVVAQDTEPTTTPAPPGTCLPGVGCGVVLVSFTALQPGTASVSASRTLCGEALACRPDQRTFSVTVIVQ